MDQYNSSPLLFGVIYTILLILLKLSLDILKRFRLNPHRSNITNILDAVLDYPKALKVGVWGENKTDIYASLQRVLKETGCSMEDFGGNDKDYTFIQRYDITRKIGLERSKAEYSPLGLLIISDGLKKRLQTRLDLFKYIKKHPNVLNTEVKSPIFITGFPRTGTTFLHELLSHHNSLRVHYTWEQLSPIPLTDSEDITELSKDRKIRYKANKSWFERIFFLVGDAIQSVHRLGYDEPEECTLLCAMELPYSLAELPLYIYAAKEVINLKGAGETYHIYKKFLQLLTFQAEDRRNQNFQWMLKCPFHLPYLTELYEAFPDATVVWTHRDPVECIASACSLYETLARMACEESSLDRIALGKAVLSYSRLALDLALETLRKLGDRVKVVHVRYADTVKNPKSCLQEVCSKSGLPYTDDFNATIDAYLAKNADMRDKLKNKKGKAAELHTYKLEDYGITKEKVKEMFGDYIAAFNLAK